MEGKKFSANFSVTSHYYLIRELPSTRPVNDSELLPEECNLNNKSQAERIPAMTPQLYLPEF